MSYVAIVNGNDLCTENDKNFSDSTYLQSLKYDLVVFVGSIDKKLDVTKSTSSIPLIWFDKDIHKDEIDYMKSNKYVQYFIDYPLSSSNNCQLGFRYNFLDVDANKTLKMIKNVMETVDRNTHLKLIPNLFTKDMIVAATKEGQTPPQCKFEQGYYTTLECDKITNKDLEKYAIIEYVNQLCYSQIDQTSFLSYLEEFFTKCAGSKTLSENPTEFYYCGRGIRAKSEYADRVQKCVDASFNGVYDFSLEPITLKNNLLEQYTKYTQLIWEKDSVHDQPKVYLNSALYTHNMHFQELKDQVCTSYLRYPEECKNLKVSWEIIALLTIIGAYFIIIVIMYFVHFAKVVNRKASLVPFEDPKNYKYDNGTDELNEDLEK